jgi:hypothetical protein
MEAAVTRALSRVALALALVLASLAPAVADTPQGAITWTVDRDKFTITVKVKLQIYMGCGGDPRGSAASRAAACQLPGSMIAGPTLFLADKIKGEIEPVWNKPYKYRCYELKFEVDVALGTDHEHLASDRIGVRIDPSVMAIRSNVHGQVEEDTSWFGNRPEDRFDPENDPDHQTTWAERPVRPYTWAHEFGHLLGLHDTYRDAIDPVTGESRSVTYEGAPGDLMSAAQAGSIDQQTIDRLVKRNIPQMRDTADNTVTEAELTCDYFGEVSGRRISGVISYCGSTESPYWAFDVVSASGDRAFVAFDIPRGSTDPVQAELVTPFVSPDWNPYVRGTGAFVPAENPKSPPHFALDIGDGSYQVTLDRGDFCEDRSPQ